MRKVMKMRKTVLGMGIGVAGCTLVGLLLGFLPWPHSLPSVSRPLCRSIQESSLPMSSVAQDTARPAMPSAVFRLQLDDADSSAGTFLQPVPTRLSQLPFPLIRELLKEPLRPLAFSGPSESGTRLVRSLPELLAASPRISAWMENGKKSSGVQLCPGIVDFEALPRTPLEPGFAGKSMVERSLRYHDIVHRFAARYGVDPALVLAVMQVESSFDPNQISGRSAHGLMQIVPETAGREVNRWLGEGGTPSAGDLLNPEQNIRYGVIYLHLLHSAHLGGIKNPLSREYCAIASYNGGSGTVLRQFGNSREEAFDVINSMTPEEVYFKLQESLPALETRSFVRKVLAARHVYAAEVGGGAVAVRDEKGKLSPLAYAD